jgi:deoxyhypusine synthase
LYFHSKKNKKLENNENCENIKIDVIEDIYKLNKFSVNSKKTGMIIIGGGLIKHHICNANMIRNGADYSVYINTANEFDGSDAGAKPDEAVSWGKIKGDEKDMIKLFTEGSLVFPLIIAETFVKNFKKKD